MTRLAVAIALLAATLGLAVAPADATQATPAVSALVRVGSAPAAPKGARELGATPSAERLRFDVVVSPRDPGGLAQFATAVATPGNPLYHQFLTASEVTARFGPLASTVAGVTSALTAAGLTVNSVSPDRTLVSVSGSAAQVDSALGVSMHSFVLASGRAAVANTQAPAFPASLAGTIEGVVGLNTFAPAPAAPPAPVSAPAHKQAAAVPAVAGAPVPCSAASTAAANAGSYTADQLAHAYSLDGLYAKGDFGAGVTVAVFALGDEYNPTDISTYQTCYGTSATITNESVDGATVTGTAGATEFTLDLETLIGLAPKAKILAYDGVNGTSNVSFFTDWLDVEKRIVTDNLAKVVNESYGICETVVDAVDPAYVTAENTNFEAAAAEGQSWLVATGDTGAQGCDRVSGGTVAFGTTNNPEHMIGVDSPRHTSYVVNPTLGTVSVVDDEAQAIVATVPIGSSSVPDAIAVDSVNDKVFVDYNNGLNVDEFDASTCNATTHSGCPTTAPAAKSTAVSSAHPAAGHLTEAAASKPASVKPDDLLPLNSTDIAVNPSTNTVYMSKTDTSHSTNYVEVFNENSPTVVLASFFFNQSTATGAPKWDPTNIAVDATANGNLYVTDLGGGSIFGISGTTCNAGNHSACGAWFDNLGNGFIPSTLVADPVSHRLFATAETSTGADPGVLVVSSAGAGIASIPLGEYVTGIDGATQIQTALSPSGNELLVTGISAGNELEGVVVIPLSSLTIAANVTMSQDCGIGTGNCVMTAMASDKTTGDVIVYSQDTAESPSVFLDFVPLDVPPNLNGLSAANPSTQPFVTAVGGTRLSAIGPAPTETPWNDPLAGNGAGTGGISQNWPMPSYQTGPGVISSLSSPNPCGAAAGSDCREVPDIAADADPETGYTLFIKGQWTGGEGGTSAAAPLVAATIALVESQFSPAPSLGLLNPTLYTLAAKGHEFNDITTGNNDYLGTGGGDYPATANYDMATGLGSPIATVLATAFFSAPGAPTSPHATVGSTTASVGWTAPTSNGGLPITGYVVTPFVGSSAQTATTFNTTATTETVSGLTNGTTYTFKVAAVNKAGTGTQSAASAAVTVGAPNAPGLQSAQPGTTTAKVSWFPGANNGAAITGYTITPFLNGTTAQAAQTFNTTAASDTVTGLVNGSSYTFKIAATNARGTGLQSNPTTIVKEGTPTAPTLPSAQPGNTTAKLIWLASTANGSSVTSYTVTPVVGTTVGTPHTFNSTATTETMTGLVNGTTYTFRIAATNANGTGPFATTTAIKEGAPTSPPFPTAQPGSTTAKVTWFAATANASPITAYVVTPVVGTTAGTPQTFNSTATSETVTGLVNGTTYTFRVAAVNGTGTGPFSTTAAIVEGAPGSPTGVSATAGTKQATVNWTAPPSNGAAITGYVVTPFIGTTAQAAHTFSSTAVSEIVTGLTTGTAYTFKVAAINSRGTGPTSAASTAVTVK